MLTFLISPHPSKISISQESKKVVVVLTLEAVGVEQVLALFVALDAALGAADALAGDAPQQALALVAVGGRGGRPQDEIVWRGARDGVDQRLQRLLVHVHFLRTSPKRR